MLEGGPGGSPSSGAATGKVPGGQSDGQAVHAGVGVDDPNLVRAVVVGGHGIAAPLVNPRGVRESGGAPEDCARLRVTT